MMLWSVKKTRIFWRQYVGNIDMVHHARDYKVKYVVATSGFFIEFCMSRGSREGFQ